MIRKAKVDSNQKSIVEALRKVGAVVVHTHQLKNAFDILVGYKGNLYIMEIKSPLYLPKEYNRERLEKELTDGERSLMNDFKSIGIEYHIVVTIDEAFSIIGATQLKTINQKIKK